MTDTEGFAQLGQKLQDFLSSQFKPTTASASMLSFCGSGVAVEPNEFMSNGAYNPARINAWLDVVVDRVAPLNAGDAAGTMLSANELAIAIVNQAASASAIGSSAAQDFGHLRGAAAGQVGLGHNAVETAPLAWYDPAELASWPTYSNSSSSGTSTSSTPPVPIDPPGPLWRWRTLPGVDRTVPIRLTPADTDPPEPAGRGGGVGRGHLPLEVSARTGAASAVESPAAQSTLMALSGLRDGTLASVIPAQVAAQADGAAPTGASLVPDGGIEGLQVTPIDVLRRAGSEAQTQAVEASSLGLSLKYQLVELARPWWPEVLLRSTTWYIPGLPSGGLIPGGQGPAVPVGVVVALVLTSGVSISGSWSSTDKQAAASATSFGPWSLGGALMTDTSATTSTLSIPATQVIGCIYRILPPLPPLPDPTLAPEDIVSQLPDVAVSANGPAVARVQGLLRAAAPSLYSDNTLAVDGDFGPVTQQAVQAFQQSNGLAADGAVRQDTWRKLLGV